MSGSPRQACASGLIRHSPAVAPACFAGMAYLLGAILSAGVLSAASPRRPNVLLLVGDDHSAEVLGCYSNPLARTPRLDRLASEGFRFDRAYTNAPICTPSRQSFLTGRYPHCNGVTLLTQALSEETVTLADRLRAAGYRTGAFGKMHFNSNLLHGFEVHRSEADWHRHVAGGPRRALPDGLEVLPAWRPFQDPARVWLNGFHRPFGRYAEEMSAPWYVQRAVEFMTEHSDEPWFVQVGFQEPHSPFWFPVEYADLYRPADVPIPQPGPEDAGQIPKIFADLTHAEKQGIKASYYTSVAWLDANVGRMLDELARLGQVEDTLVIYLGDNGYHLGEHGRFEKHTLYERCVRVPLIMRCPGRVRSGGTSTALVELVDVAPTVLDFAGVSVADSSVGGLAGRPVSNRALHGHSLRPLMEGSVASVREAVFSEYQHTEQAMVRTERHKLIYRTSPAPVDWYEPVMRPRGRQVQLFDLVSDPQEHHDLAADPALAGRIEELLEALAAWYERYPPFGSVRPASLTREAFLDWAIAPRLQPTTKP